MKRDGKSAVPFLRLVDAEAIFAALPVILMERAGHSANHRLGQEQETVMNSCVGYAAGASFATFLIHTFIGGSGIARPLLKAGDLGKCLKYTAYYCWHMVTVLSFAMSIGLGYAAWRGERALAIFVLLLAAAFCVLSLGMVIRFRIHPGLMPQWMLFLIITILLAIGIFGH